MTVTSTQRPSSHIKDAVVTIQLKCIVFTFQRNCTMRKDKVLKLFQFQFPCSQAEVFNINTAETTLLIKGRKKSQTR